MRFLKVGVDTWPYVEGLTKEAGFQWVDAEGFQEGDGLE